MNRGIEVLQTFALPLGYATICLLILPPAALLLRRANAHVPKYAPLRSSSRALHPAKFPAHTARYIYLLRCRFVEPMLLATWGYDESGKAGVCFAVHRFGWLG